MHNVISAFSEDNRLAGDTKSCVNPVAAFREKFDKVVEQQLTDVTTDVLCDVCGSSTTRQPNGSPDYASLTANWGYGSPHDGDSYETHLCEPCFFQTLAYLKQQRKGNSIGCDNNQNLAEEFGLELTRL